jgi:glycosyltransferase involved in cell wall biosynthesis
MTLADGADALAVDIVISNHNYGAFVDAAVQSALGQQHPQVRVVVVDDGSTDDSRERLGAYASTVDLVLQENRGQAAALNAGLARCRGDIVLFLDADDVLRPDVATRVAAAFAADPRAAKAQFRMDVIDATGQPTGATKPPPHLPLPSGDLRRAEVCFPFDIPWLPTSGNAFRATALRRILPIPVHGDRRCGADWHLTHLATLLGSVVSLEQVGASYRVHGANRYEPQQARLDLGHVRETIGFAQTTVPALERLADEIGLRRPSRVLSVSDLGNRLLSLRLDPALHPLPDDTIRGIVADGVRASRRRFDVSPPMRLVYVAWLAAVAVAPRALARRLGELFLFPQRREALNRLLGRLQRPRAGVR